jgi:hypothetical protein
MKMKAIAVQFGDFIVMINLLPFGEEAIASFCPWM